MRDPKKRKISLGNWSRNDVKLLCCIVLFIGATVVKFSETEWVQQVRQVLTRTVSGGAQVSEVVEAFGQSIGPDGSLRDALQSDAVAVFAGKMIGKDTGGTDPQAEEETGGNTPQQEETETEQKEGETATAGGVSVFLPSETALPIQAGFLSVESNTITGIAPVQPVICTSAFGQREHPLDGEVKEHTGMDLAGDMGQEIAAFADGVVKETGYNAEYGNYILLSHANGVETLYAHCSALLRKEGEQVEQGMAIARVGQTGKATGPHVHLEVRVGGVCQNPANYLVG